MARDRREYLKERRRRLNAEGLCGDCGKELLYKGGCCEKCYSLHLQRHNADRIKLKNQGICVDCRKHPIVMQERCQECLLKKRASDLKGKVKCIQQGRCPTCGRDKNGETDFVECIVCRARKELRW